MKKKSFKTKHQHLLHQTAKNKCSLYKMTEFLETEAIMDKKHQISYFKLDVTNQN